MSPASWYGRERSENHALPVPFEYPFAPPKVVDLFVEYYGPTNRAYASLNNEGRRALHDDLTALWIRNNTATDGTTRVPAEYIEAVGTRT